MLSAVWARHAAIFGLMLTVGCRRSASPAAQGSGGSSSVSPPSYEIVWDGSAPVPGGWKGVADDHWAFVPLPGDRAELVLLGGGEKNPRLVVSGAPRQLTWDATHLYFARGLEIVRVPKGGAPVEQAIATSTMLGELRVSDAYVFWTEQDTRRLAGPAQTARPGAVHRARRDGDGAHEIVSGVAPRSLALDAAHVYFNDGAAIERAAHDGSHRERLVDDAGQTPLLRVAGEWLYFTRRGGVSRVSLRDRKVEVVAEEIEIPIGLEVRGSAAFVLANAVLNRVHPEHARPARLLRVEPGKPPTTLWSRTDVLVSDLDVHRDGARILVRDVGGSSTPTVATIRLGE
jgi:hypothetical protein